MTKIILYHLLYLSVGTLILVATANINLISVNLDETILSLLVSIGSGLSWVAILIPRGIIISLIKYVERKR